MFIVDWNHHYALPAFIILMYLVGFYLKDYKEILFAFLPFLIAINIPILDGSGLLFTIILYNILLPLSLFLGYSLRQKNIFLKAVYPIVIVLFSIFGFGNFISYGNGLNSHFNEKAPEINLLTQQRDTLNLKDFKNKIIVLDFWTTSCGVCFVKFPKFEEVYLEYKSNKKVLFYSVNVPYSGESVEENIKFAEEKVNYKFTNLFAESSAIIDSLDFNLFPKLIIIKDGKIRYKGLLILDKKIKVHHLRTEIDRLLEE